MTEPANSPLESLVSVLERRQGIPALPALVDAVKAAPHSAVISNSAIILDSSVLLRISSHKKSSDIIDYLISVHTQPVLLPGQVIQEFWNNQLSAVNSIFKNLAKKHQELSRETDKAREAGISGTDGVSSALEDFKSENEHVFDPDIVAKTSGLLEGLVEKAVVPFAPRPEFYELALYRKRSKTPPGFKDEGDGDFLVWVDSLWGLLETQSGGADFQNVVLLTNDEKIDWCRGVSAHPVLCAEMKALLNVHFEIWTLDQFADRLAAM